MCTICGTLLELAENAQADREREFIRGLIAQGLTKEQIKDALVREYGDSVLATPDDSGFDLTAWLLPFIAAGLGIAGVGIAVYRWRRERPDEPDSPAARSAPAAPTPSASTPTSRATTFSTVNGV